MSSEPEMSAKDKTVLRMTRDGAVEENMTEGTAANISNRLDEPELVKPHEIAVSEDISKKPRQQKIGEALRSSEGQREVPLSEAQNQISQFHDIPISVSSPIPIPIAGVHHASPVNMGVVVAETVVTHKLRKTKKKANVDVNSVLNKADDVASNKPVADGSSQDKKIQRLEGKSEKLHDRLDKAREKIPARKVVKKERVFDENTGKGKTRLSFEDELKMPKQQSKLAFEAEKQVNKVGNTFGSVVHGKIHEVERDNSGVEAAHKTEIVAEAAVNRVARHREHSANKPYEKVSKLEHKADATDTKLHVNRTMQESPEMQKKSGLSKQYQKRKIKKQYAAAKKAGSQTAGNAASSGAKKTSEKAADKVKDFISKNKKVFLWLGAGVLIIVLISAGISACTAMLSQTGGAVIASSYLSEDEAMLGAEAAYSGLEANLRNDLANFENLHPGFDEYRYELDDIEHDPYVLVSILSAFYEGEFTLAEIQGMLGVLFEKQYILTLTEEVEVRYRTETRTGSYTVTDPETGETSTETYSYEVQVPYNYYILNVDLENFNLSHVPVYIMSEDQLSMYAVYMSGLGNREDLFPSSSYVDKYITNPPQLYEVPAAYLDDATFSTLLTEAEKYLYYPYVWGGSSPATSFDCSGFVSYVLTNSGLVNTGRLGAQGIYNVCTPISRANAKPGDLIFFVGTYDTPGVSHVGIYVGDGVMLHCGDPIHYTSIDTSYWQQHFYAFGRPAY